MKKGDEILHLPQNEKQPWLQKTGYIATIDTLCQEELIFLIIACSFVSCHGYPYISQLQSEGYQGYVQST